LEILNLGPDIAPKDLGDRDEWEVDGTIFQKVTNLSIQVSWPDKNDVDVLQLHILPKFPNLKFLELQRFSYDLYEDYNEEDIQVPAVKHIEDLSYFQICPKLKTVSVTNVGQVEDQEYHVAVDKETFERIAAELREVYEDSDSDSSTVVSESLSLDSD